MLCRFEESLYKGTIFEGARVGYITLLKVLFYWFLKIPNKTICIILGISPDCFTFTLKKALNLVENKYYSSLPMIGGSGIVVEVDKSKFRKRKYHRGHNVDSC